MLYEFFFWGGGRGEEEGFHTLAFTLFLVMVDPCFISREDSFQEEVAINTIALQKPFADDKTFLFGKF